jgi:MFS family permease
MGAVGMSEGSYWTASVRIGGRRGATAAGILNTGGNAGGLPAPVLMPLIGTSVSWRAALGVAAVVCVAGAALWLPVDPSDRLDEPAPLGERPI